MSSVLKLEQLDRRAHDPAHDFEAALLRRGLALAPTSVETLQGISRIHSR